MHILYGVQTTGHGHIVRSGAIIRQLKARGHHVETLLSGPEVESCWLDQTFEPWSHRRGLTHISVNGKISYWHTARQLRPLQFCKDLREIDASTADLVICDYEPLTSRAARRAGVPSIGIGHLYAFNHSVPMAGKNRMNQEIMRRFARVDVPLGLHWHHFDQAILPPMIPDDVPSAEETTEDGPILVYLGFESLDTVVRALGQMRHLVFRVYARDFLEHNYSNVEILPIGRDRFLRDLVRSRGVICNTGFSLVSEALHLGKRVLTKPVRHQTEQESNARALEALDLGQIYQHLDRETLDHWLAAPPPAPMRYPDAVTAVIHWIEAGNWDDPRRLSENLWSAVNISGT